MLGGPQGLLQFIMLQNDTYVKLAAQNASAVKGLQPKISVWNTGDQGSGDAGTAPIRNLMQSLPPLLQTVQEQTGITPPSWLATMPPQQAGQGQGQQRQGNEVVKAKKGMVNGEKH